MHTYISIHTCIHTNIHTHIHIHIHTYIHTYKHKYKHTCIHTYILTYIHTFIRTHTGIHHSTHIDFSIKGLTRKERNFENFHEQLSINQDIHTLPASSQIGRLRLIFSTADNAVHSVCFLVDGYTRYSPFLPEYHSCTPEGSSNSLCVRYCIPVFSVQQQHCCCAFELPLFNLFATTFLFI